MSKFFPDRAFLKFYKVGPSATTGIWRQQLQVTLLACGIVALSLVGWRVWLQTAAAQVPRSTGAIPTKAFDLNSATIPRDEIRAGGPPVDGIPALTLPKFVAPEEATFLQPTDRVIGVVTAGVAKAYPLRLLNYHEVVNDQAGNEQIVVTYCPLCDSAIVYNRQLDGVRLEFGVSGLLYNSNVLMYDRQKADRPSLWSQVQATGVAGPYVNQKLSMVPYEVTTWALWRERFPQTRVLSTETGYVRDYSRSPYERYFSTPDLMFPVRHNDDRLQKKTPVLGVWKGRVSTAFPLTAFRKMTTPQEVKTIFDGQPLVVHYDPHGPSLRVVQSPAGTQWMYSLWFAWAAFYPDTAIFEVP